MKTVIFISIFYVFILHAYSQSTTKFDSSKYRLGKTIFQNGCQLLFWEGSADQTKYEVVVEEKFKGISTLSAMKSAMNGEYSLADKNNDGFIDFTTNYHGYDIVYLFNPTSNNFEKAPVHIPEETQLIDKKRNIYCCYSGAQYGDPVSFSILYQFTGNRLINKFKLIYVTKLQDYDEDVIRIDLYRMSDVGKHAEQFIKTINTKSPSMFKYSNYWKRKYRKLLGYK